MRRFTASEVPALAERVVSLAQGVLDERYPVTDTPHRELCADCPGRRAMCSHPEERTLAPAGDSAGEVPAGESVGEAAAPPQASAGSLAGNGGPS